MVKKVKVKGREFKLSSKCNAASTACCAVSITDECVAMLNTTNQKKIVNFTLEEWTAFIEGVKNGEFDL